MQTNRCAASRGADRHRHVPQRVVRPALDPRLYRELAGAVVGRLPGIAWRERARAGGDQPLEAELAEQGGGLMQIARPAPLQDAPRRMRERGDRQRGDGQRDQHLDEREPPLHSTLTRPAPLTTTRRPAPVPAPSAMVALSVVWPRGRKVIEIRPADTRVEADASNRTPAGSARVPPSLSKRPSDSASTRYWPPSSSRIVRTRVLRLMALTRASSSSETSCQAARSSSRPGNTALMRGSAAASKSERMPSAQSSSSS